MKVEFYIATCCRSFVDWTSCEYLVYRISLIEKHIESRANWNCFKKLFEASIAASCHAILRSRRWRVFSSRVKLFTDGKVSRITFYVTLWRKILSWLNSTSRLFNAIKHKENVNLWRIFGFKANSRSSESTEMKTKGLKEREVRRWNEWGGEKESEVTTPATATIYHKTAFLLIEFLFLGKVDAK